jgi:putative endonuclease
MTIPVPSCDPTTLIRAGRGRRSQSDGIRAEAACCARLQADGWTILGQRVMTQSGEIDILAEYDGLLAIIEVKRRAHLANAAHALSARQCARLIAAASIVLGDHPDWGAKGVRFDLMLVDDAGRIRRIIDAFRME